MSGKFGACVGNEHVQEHVYSQERYTDNTKYIQYAVSVVLIVFEGVQFSVMLACKKI